MKSKMMLSVAIPVYRSAELIELFYAQITAIMKGLGCAYELLFEVDGSPDNSTEILRAIAVRDGCVNVCSRADNQGLGCTLRSLFRSSRGEYVLYLDIDAVKSFDLSYIPRFLDLMKSYDVIIASRYGKGQQRHMPLFRLIPSRAYYYLNRFLLSLPVSDITSGFQLFSGDLVRSLSLTAAGFDIHLELFLKLNMRGARFLEVEVPYKHYHKGSFRPFTHGPAMFARTLFWYGRYRSGRLQWNVKI